ncbi:MAG TPA: hypothetical protein VJ083_01405 [Sedimentibacter sp.]|nr:hypothetical protein [Sedimentibacter sp.]
MKRLICILLIIMILSTSCTSLLKVDEDKVKDVSDLVTDALINTVGQEKTEKKESHTVESADVNTINLNSSVGDISITSHQSDDTIINISITAKAGSKEKAEEIIENYKYTVKTEGNSIVVDTSFNEPLSGISLITDLVIYIPSSIKDIEVSTNVGDVHLSGISSNFQIDNNVGEITIDKSEGSYNIKVGVGAIVLKDCTAIGNSEFKSNTGEIDMSFSNISKAVSIIAETGVGDIQMSINDDSGYHATINEFMKDERIETKNDQGTNINLTTGVGEIDFN